jgi:hypothetical protein
MPPWLPVCSSSLLRTVSRMILCIKVSLSLDLLAESANHGFVSFLFSCFFAGGVVHEPPSPTFMHP